MKGISFVVGKNLREPNSPSNVRAKIRCPSTAGTRIFVTSKRWWSIISLDLFDTKAKTFPSTEWKRHLATVRSTLTEIFLWFIREVSSAEIQQDFEQVFRSHILQNQANAGPTNPFNGLLKATTSPTTRIPLLPWNGSSRRWFVGDLKRSSNGSIASSSSSRAGSGSGRS
jgi:hypothetical protein